MGDQYPVDQLRGGLTLASICCVLYSVSASPFRSLTLLDADSGPAVAIQFRGEVRPDGAGNRPPVRQFLLFLFPLLTTMQLLKLQWSQHTAGLWGTAYRLYGLVYHAVTNPPVYD